MDHIEELLPYEAPAPAISLKQAKDLLGAYEWSSRPITRDLWCYEVFGGNHSITKAYGAKRWLGSRSVKTVGYFFDIFSRFQWALMFDDQGMSETINLPCALLFGYVLSPQLLTGVISSMLEELAMQINVTFIL